MARETAIVGSTAYHITRWNDARHFFKRIQIDEGRRPVSMEFVEKVAKFDLHDFRAMFAPHDLEIEQVFGDYALNPFDPATSPRLMLLARKGGAVCSAPLAA
jgi:hypothetical protein